MTKVFGQTMKKSTRYQRQFGASSTHRSSSNDDTERRRIRLEREKQRELHWGITEIGVPEATAEPQRGWLYNMVATTVSRSMLVVDTCLDASSLLRSQVPVSSDESSSAGERSGLDLYFCTASGSTFRSTILHRPYFYVVPDLTGVDEPDILLESVQSALQRKFESCYTQLVHKTDLDQPNHLSPRNKERPMIQLHFDTVSQLVAVRDAVQELLRKQEGPRQTWWGSSKDNADPLQCLIDIREYDVPYVVRVAMDLNVRAGTWYTVAADEDRLVLLEPDHETKAQPTILAFDIECTKAPLKFPSAEVDEIFMISYMVKDAASATPQGYLINSRSVVSQDVGDFEYTPQPQYPGPFTVFMEDNEKALLERFLAEYRRHGPHIVVTYNGDFFDWPFVEARCAHHGLDLYEQTGVQSIQDTYRGRASVHLDAFHWVQRDSYLPQGSQGLKAVTKYKLGYDPVEVDPEDMVRFAQEKPFVMATYSVSDAVATFYLYEKYVHLFNFSLCTIIPFGPEDVLRKGSGTLCETLLMVQATRKNIICPNSQKDSVKFYQGHLLEGETYIGGKVECLETGVYRSDIEYDFDLKPPAFDQLIANIDRDLTFAIETEGKKKREDMVNYDEVRLFGVDDFVYSCVV